MIKHSVIEPANNLLRTALENFFSIEYLLEEDQYLSQRAASFMVWFFVEQQRWLKQGDIQFFPLNLSLHSVSSLETNLSAYISMHALHQPPTLDMLGSVENTYGSRYFSLQTDFNRKKSVHAKFFGRRSVDVDTIDISLFLSISQHGFLTGGDVRTWTLLIEPNPAEPHYLPFQFVYLDSASTLSHSR